jgi:hypothetical protein
MSVRDESAQVVIYFCMEAMLESLCIAILISSSKNAMSFLLLLMYTLQQNWRKEQNRFCLEESVVGRRGGAGGRSEKWPK